jgi:hypothetical protein
LIDLSQNNLPARARVKRMRACGKSPQCIAGKLALGGYKLNPESARRIVALAALIFRVR